MTASLIGVLSGIIVISFIRLLKGFDKPLLYAMILTGIGFLYVGFTWMNLTELMVTSVQAVLFIFLSYYGFKKHTCILAIGYFLHGGWDMIYHYVTHSALIPPQYHWFCFTIDFTMGIYLLILFKQLPQPHSLIKRRTHSSNVTKHQENLA